jgi:glycosyltransferase involved in cell wall biosynthesis
VTENISPPAVLRCITRLNAGGPTRHVVWLERGLTARDHRTRLLHGQVQDGEDDLGSLVREGKLDVVEIPDLGRRVDILSDWKALRAVAHQITAFRPQIVHTHTAKAGVVGRLAAVARRPGASRPRLVHTFHGHVLTGYFNRLEQAAIRWFERRLGHHASDAIIVLSPHQRHDIVERFRIAPAHRVHVVPLGLDLAPFAGRPTGPPLHDELGLPDESFLVGIVGRLAPVKDHELFLRAAGLLARRRPEARFVVVGGGPREPELRSLAADLGVGDRVHFLGLRTDLARIYAGLDALTLTSRHEGTPLSILEAMAAGCPVVATAVGGVPDLVESEFSGPVGHRTFQPSSRQRGLLVGERTPEAVAAALERLITEPPLRHSLVDEARRYVRRFHGLDRLLDDVEEVYRRVLAEGGAGPPGGSPSSSSR